MKMVSGRKPVWSSAIRKGHAHVEAQQVGIFCVEILHQDGYVAHPLDEPVREFIERIVDHLIEALFRLLNTPAARYRLLYCRIARLITARQVPER